MKFQRERFTISSMNENNLNSYSEQTIALAHRRRDLKNQVKSGVSECISLKLPFTISDVVKKIHKDNQNEVSNSFVGRILKDDLMMSYK